MTAIFHATWGSCLNNLYILLQLWITMLFSHQFPGLLFVHNVCLQFVLPIYCPGWCASSPKFLSCSFLNPSKAFLLLFVCFHMSTCLYRVNSNCLASTPYADLICVWLGYQTLIVLHISPQCSYVFIKKQIWSIQECEVDWPPLVTIFFTSLDFS